MSRIVTIAFVISVTFGALSVPVTPMQAQKQTGIPTQRRQATILSSYEYGYSNGYKDGYTSGMTDYREIKEPNHKRSNLYRDATRGYESRYGSLTQYQEGYRLGFGIAYTDGYYGRTFNSQVPPNLLALKGIAAQTGRPQWGRVHLIPDNTVMRIRLTTQLNTKIDHEGGSFSASVIEPMGYRDATIEGHIAKLNRSGTMTGRTELAVDFDRIILRDGRTGAFSAQIEKVYATESVKSVDEEGNIESASKTKETEIRTAGGAVLGAIIGAIASGGTGAAIGAIIGAGAGAGSVYVQGKKDLILEPGTQMSIRTITPQRASARQ